MHTIKADDSDRLRVESDIRWNRRWHQSFGGLYYNEELAGPDGVSVRLYTTTDTPAEQIDRAVKEARYTCDVVSIHCMQCPAEWLQGDQE